MSGTTRSKVDCRGRSARVEVIGEGSDVVFSGEAAPLMWSRPAAAALAEQGYRVVNFDYGSESDNPVARSALDQVQDVVDVMDALEIQAAPLVGLSRGAMTAFGAAAEYPDRVSSLVLAFPVAGFADTLGFYQPDPEPEPGEDPEAFMRRLLGRLFSEEFLSTRFADAVTLATMAPGEVVRLDRSEEDPFPEDMAVGCDTLVIEGGADQIVTAEHPARYLKALPTAEHHFVPGASHGWLMERPVEFSSILADFFRRRRGEPRRVGRRGAAGSDRSQPV